MYRFEIEGNYYLLPILLEDSYKRFLIVFRSEVTLEKFCFKDVRNGLPWKVSRSMNIFVKRIVKIP